MCLYAVSLQPLIARLNASTFVKQCWFADNATGAGSLGELKKWCGVLNESGPNLGYFPNAKKCWLIVKPEKEEAARDLNFLVHLHSGSKAFRSSARLTILS